MIFEKWFKYMVIEQTDINPPSLSTIKVMSGLNKPKKLDININKLINELNSECALVISPHTKER